MQIFGNFKTTTRIGLFVLLGALLTTFITGLAESQLNSTYADSENRQYLPIILTGKENEYVVIGWNDLGMHCYDLDYSVMSILPPYNTLWAQVVRRGDPPEVVSQGLQLNYSFGDNTYSVGKTNFWDYVEDLFGVILQPNIGLTGKGLWGEMDIQEDHFIAEGIPITEFSDSNLVEPEYLQLATIALTDQLDNLLARTYVVAPVSSEMRCDTCHDSPDPNNFRMNVLEKHDDEEDTDLATQAKAGNPVLCADCHSDPALGMVGNPDLPSLSAAIHGEHEEVTSDCYACHPGQYTKCLRGTMANDYGMECVHCHEGGMSALGDEDRTPWFDEPQCGDCHGPAYSEEPGKLFRFSKGHGGLYCESCHNSTHAILPSREAPDNLQSIILQGFDGTIRKCTVCHLTEPTSGGPHQ